MFSVQYTVSTKTQFVFVIHKSKKDFNKDIVHIIHNVGSLILLNLKCIICGNLLFLILPKSEQNNLKINSENENNDMWISGRHIVTSCLDGNTH